MKRPFTSLIESQQMVAPGVQERIFELASAYKQNPKGDCLRGKRVGMLFYEASTRTRWSFEAAVDDLGGSRISTENAREFSSATKGERLEDTIRVIAGYVDCIVLRHYEDDSSQRARDLLDSIGCKVSVINAGSGEGQHPSQAALDRFTIREELGRTEGLDIAIVGDIRRSRTARSLAYLMGRERNRIHLVSPLQLRMKSDLLGYLARHEVPVKEYRSLDDVLGIADVVYMLRTQNERPSPGMEPLTEADVLNCRMTLSRAQSVKKGGIIMHPLPIVDEIVPEVQYLPHASYFRQSDNGVPVRKALFEIMFG